MERDILELANNSLFIDNIIHTFMSADNEFFTMACAFSTEGAYGHGVTPLKTSELLPDQLDTITFVCPVLQPLLWQNSANSSEIKKTAMSFQ